jgi:hypothetical protein
VEKALRGPFSVEKLTLWLKPAEFRDFRAVRNLLTRGSGAIAPTILSF